MRLMIATLLVLALCAPVVLTQTPQKPQKREQEPVPDDIIRITTELVQTDVFVTDKNEKIISDLTINDFKIFENGKRQEVKFMQFVSPEAAPRIEGVVSVAGRPVDSDVSRNLTAGEVHRVLAFVVDDLTIPFEDVISVRNLLTDFVDNRMREGDLVAIVRVVGGNGLLQQFTSDKRILRRAIERITPQLNPYSAFNNLPSDQQTNTQRLQAAETDSTSPANFPAEAISESNTNLDESSDGVTRGLRALATLSVAAEMTNNMKALSGRKSLVLISGGLPLSESRPNQITIGGVPVSVMETRSYLTNVTTLLRQLIDRASRAGVVINTMDIRGLKASRGVALFTDPGNEATSHLGGGGPTGSGRLPNMATFDNLALDTLSGHQGLQALAESTGGVSVINTSNFREGLDKVLARSSYYLLAYTPTEPFDNKYHKLEIKVSRPGAKVYSREGYFATPDAPAGAQMTKEQAILKAARSPLAKREVEIAGRLQYRFLPENAAEVDINLLINANNLEFTQGGDGKYLSTFDVVGFLVNSLGKSQGGFSQTVTTNLSPEDYKRALTSGVSFTGHAQLPPGSYQLRVVVRTENGRLGSMAQYLEVPDLSKKNLTASSIFLYAVDPTQGANAKPQPLTALRQLPRKQDLRYAAVIYFPKVTDGKTQIRSQVIVSRGDKVIFQEPDQPVTAVVQNDQAVKIGQLGLGKAQPGRYVLTLVVKEPMGNKKERTIVRSVDFNLVD
ncbi:MAG: hypothetical protein JWM21_322 [Acidobacteria bacterium]|nr:hypothetical protein [Acidobacteriota bacterium]